MRHEFLKFFFWIFLVGARRASARGAPDYPGCQALVGIDSTGFGASSRPRTLHSLAAVSWRISRSPGTIRCQWNNSVSVRHYCFPWEQFGVSSSLLLPLHQVGKLVSWEDFQDRQAIT